MIPKMVNCDVEYIWKGAKNTSMVLHLEWETEQGRMDGYITLNPFHA